MDYIALTGSIKSGKTTVARALEKKGYLLISYTDLLKEYVARALTGAGFPTQPSTILAHKEQYRALIQEFGTVIGFDQGGDFMSKAFAGWDGHQRVVFDNIRTDEQAASLPLGFDIVRLEATHETRADRIRAEGDDPEQVLARESHHIESGISDDWVDLVVTTDIGTPEMVADFLATLVTDPYADFEGHPDTARDIEELANE